MTYWAVLLSLHLPSQKKTSRIFLSRMIQWKMFFSQLSKEDPQDFGKKALAILLWLGDLFRGGEFTWPLQRLERWPPTDLHASGVKASKPPIYGRHEVRPVERSPTTRIFRGLNKPWLLTTYLKWDDPPSTQACLFSSVLQDIFLCVNAKPRSSRNTWIWVIEILGFLRGVWWRP